MITKRRAGAYLLGIILLVAALTAVVTNRITVRELQKVSPEYQELETLRQLIDQNYYAGVDDKALFEGAKAGLVAGLQDPYSHYYTAEQNALLMEVSAGAYSGIGVAVQRNPDTGVVTIIRVYEGSPAEQQGLKAGAAVVKVAGEDVGERTLDELVAVIKGQPGTKVTITIEQGGEQRDVELTRAQIQIRNVAYRMLEGGVGYIEIAEFLGRSAEEFQQAVDALKAQGMQKLVVDLRNNPGGYLNHAVEISDILLPEGLIVSIRDRAGQEKTYSSDANALGIPLAILVNEHSASASEIVSGAVKDYGVGILVGQKTFGKGVVQSVLPLEGGAALWLTTATYYTPNGTSIHGVGIAPDIQVEIPAYYTEHPEEFNEAADTQLQRALEELNKQ
ncbi:peptidase S41 [Bacteroidia bacterium]|nr:peptidase S41 [Bacteroidia bacterium]